MARVSIFYDDSKKEQFFMIRGDERYSRSTKTVLEKVSVDLDRFKYDCVLNVNVLRDVGKGSIVIYNNEVPITVSYYDDSTETYIESDSIPWESTFNGAKFKISSLAYDVDNNITAEYIGNKSCSPSLSNIVTVFEKDTNRTAPIITIDNVTQFNQNTTITKNIVLSNDLNPSYNEGQVFEVLYDGQLLGTTEPTDENGATSIEIPVGNNGLHTITVDYDESEHLLPKTLTQNISVGYEVTIISYPKIIAIGENCSVTANIQDYFGNLQDIENIFNVKLQAIASKGTVQNYYWDMDKISNGVYSITIPITFNHSNIHTLSVGLWNGDVKRYSSADIPVTVIAISSLTITSSTPQLYENEGNVVSIQTNSSPVVEGIPIQLTGSIEETVYTGSNGLATKTLIGTGRGSKTITASVGNKTASITLDDYIQYWDRPDSPKGRNYSLYPPSPYTELLDLANYYKLIFHDGYMGFVRLEGNKFLEYEYTISNLRVDLDMPLQIVGNGVINHPDTTYNIPLSQNTNYNIRVRRENTSMYIYSNNVLLTTLNLPNTSQLPMFGIVDMEMNVIEATFTKLTYRRL